MFSTRFRSFFSGGAATRVGAVGRKLLNERWAEQFQQRMNGWRRNFSSSSSSSSSGGSQATEDAIRGRASSFMILTAFRLGVFLLGATNLALGIKEAIPWLEMEKLKKEGRLVPILAVVGDHSTSESRPSIVFHYIPPDDPWVLNTAPNSQSILENSLAAASMAQLPPHALERGEAKMEEMGTSSESDPFKLFTERFPLGHHMVVYVGKTSPWAWEETSSSTPGANTSLTAASPYRSYLKRYVERDVPPPPVLYNTWTGVVTLIWAAVGLRNKALFFSFALLSFATPNLLMRLPRANDFHDQFFNLFDNGKAPRRLTESAPTKP